MGRKKDKKKIKKKKKHQPPSYAKAEVADDLGIIVPSFKGKPPPEYEEAPSYFESVRDNNQAENPIIMTILDRLRKNVKLRRQAERTIEEKGGGAFVVFYPRVEVAITAQGGDYLHWMSVADLTLRFHEDVYKESLRVIKERSESKNKCNIAHLPILCVIRRDREFVTNYVFGIPFLRGEEEEEEEKVDNLKDIPPDVYVCASCAMLGAKHTCKKCKCVSYCSKKCQVKDWGVHKMVCDNLSASASDLFSPSSLKT